MKNNLQNNKALEKKIDWQNVKNEMREKFGYLLPYYFNLFNCEPLFVFCQL